MSPTTLSRRKPEGPLETPGVGRPYFGVDDARRTLAVERVENLLGRDPAHVLARFLGDPGRVRARQHVVELQQRVLRRRRLLVPDVAPGPGDTFFAQRIVQRPLIVNETARGRDEERVRLHQRELLRAD